MHQHNDFRSYIGRVRGLGSAKHGTAHWWSMRLTSLALIVLCGWFIVKLIFCLAGGDYATTIAWLKHPLPAALMCLFLLTGFHHAANGLQTVIEDYVHCERAKLFALIIIKCFAAVFAVTGLIAVGKIAFGG
jgi:succinate dehydrogenase / fumarate reductase membrane anchor subunit